MDELAGGENTPRGLLNVAVAEGPLTELAAPEPATAASAPLVMSAIKILCAPEQEKTIVLWFPKKDPSAGLLEVLPAVLT